MSYDTYDLSVSLGSPAELYRFTYWENTYRYCTLDGGVGDFSYVIGGAAEVFTPTTIKRGNAEVTEELSRNTMEITVPSTFPVAQLFIAGPPDGVIGVTIFRYHTTNPTNGYITVFKGRVLACGFKDDEATMTCEPIFTSLRRPGLRMNYDPQCQHDLYGPGCRLGRSDWQIPATVLSVSGLNLTIQAAAGYGTGWFVGGMLVIGNVRRVITANVGTTVTVMHPVPTTVTGASCLLHPGCDHTRASCNTKFNNILNYGGFPWMPLRSPYSGDNVFW